MTTKALASFHPSRILNKIRELRKSYETQDKKLEGIEISLTQAVYTFYEGRMVQGATKREVSRELVKAVGSNTPYWTHLYREGLSIKTLSLDPLKINHAALRKIAYNQVTGKQDKKTFRTLLNNGANGNEVERKLRLLGYKSLAVMPKSTKQTVRKNKKDWIDWERELNSLLANIEMTTDKKPAPLIQLVLRVNGRDRLTVSNR